MLNAANIDAPRNDSHTGHAERFTSRDPSQIVYRRLLAMLDEDQLIDIETDISYFVQGGEMSRHLSALLTAADKAA